MRRFKVTLTAMKVVEISLNDNDLLPHEESLEEGAEQLALENAFRWSHQDMVKIIDDWDVSVEDINEVVS